MPEQSSALRWAAAANWAAVGGFGVGAIAQREGVSRIDALLAVADEWARHPHLFTAPPAVVQPVGADQCPECGIWFSDVEAHRVVHRNGPEPSMVERRLRGTRRHRLVDPPRVGRRPPRPRAGAAAAAPGPLEPPPPGRGIQVAELPTGAPWRTWAEAANWAAANGLGPSRLADRVGTDAASVTVAIIDAWSHDPAAFTVPAAVNAPGGALKQCPACGLWFASVDNHVAAHGRISGRRRGSAGPQLRVDDEGPEHDGHAAPRTEFERDMERRGLLDHYLELRRCVLEHLSPPQFRTRVDLPDRRVPHLLERICAHECYPVALGDLLCSRAGVLFDDGDRVQCHVCGLWTPILAPHLAVHEILPAAYRLRYGLAEDDALVSRSISSASRRAPRRAADRAKA